MNTIHGPPRGRMGSQPRIVVRLLDQILRTGPLIVEPRQQVDGVLHVGDEHAIAVLRRVEQLVLLRLVRLARPARLLIAQGDEAIGFLPAFRLIAKLTSSALTANYLPSEL